jgi:hypothetical protein
MFLGERVRSNEEVILGDKASYMFLGEKAMQVVDGPSREKAVKAVRRRLTVPASHARKPVEVCSQYRNKPTKCQRAAYYSTPYSVDPLSICQICRVINQAVFGSRTKI